MSKAKRELKELRSKNKQINSHVLRIEKELYNSNETVGDLKDKNATMNENCKSLEDMTSCLSKKLQKYNDKMDCQVNRVSTMSSKGSRGPILS